MNDFIQKGIKARGLACELRGLLEELEVEAVAESCRLDGEGKVKAAECFDALAMHLGDSETAVEEVEGFLDAEFPIERYPSADPSTWRKDK